MSYTENLKKDIRDAYVFLRENNQDIPDRSLEFIFEAALQKANKITSPQPGEFYIVKALPKPNKSFLKMLLDE